MFSRNGVRLAKVDVDGVGRVDGEAAGSPDLRALDEDVAAHRVVDPIDLDDDAQLDDLIRNRADTVYHPVGTCRMGPDEDAVVDPTLKARGVDGLYVADASVMPRLVSGNTNAPSIMIGERCAEFVKTALAA